MPAAPDSEVDVRGSSPMEVESDDVCWICLDEQTSHGQHLFSPCSCPRRVHPKCLARWQLQQAGRPEETQCRFCHSTLADWKASLTPDNLKPDVKKVQPIMVVYFEGEIHRIPVKQGPDGLTDFTSRIRELFRLPEEVDISLTFGCKEPMSGQHLKLEGIGAFDAAVHCASVAAAERQSKLRSNSSGNLMRLVSDADEAVEDAPGPAIPTLQSRSSPGTTANSAAASPPPPRGSLQQPWHGIVDPQQQGPLVETSPDFYDFPPSEFLSTSPAPSQGQQVQLNSSSQNQSGVSEPVSPPRTCPSPARISPAASLVSSPLPPPAPAYCGQAAQSREPGATARRARAYSATARAGEIRVGGSSSELPLAPGTPPATVPPVPRGGLFSALSRSGRQLDQGTCINHWQVPAYMQDATTRYGRDDVPQPSICSDNGAMQNRTVPAPYRALPPVLALRQAGAHVLPPHYQYEAPMMAPRTRYEQDSLATPPTNALVSMLSAPVILPTESPLPMEMQGSSDDIVGRANRRMRRAANRASDPLQPGGESVPGTTPEATITGRLRCTLKTFGRKVARTLAFVGSKSEGGVSASASPRVAVGGGHPCARFTARSTVE